MDLLTPLQAAGFDVRADGTALRLRYRGMPIGSHAPEAAARALMVESASARA
jgi:hypothetical protein